MSLFRSRFRVECQDCGHTYVASNGLTNAQVDQQLLNRGWIVRRHQGRLVVLRCPRCVAEGRTN